MNTVLLAGLALLLITAAATRWKVMRKTFTLSAALSWARFPSLLQFPTLPMLQPTVEAAVVVLGRSDSAALDTAAAFVLAAVAGAFALLIRFVFQPGAFGGTFVYFPPPDSSAADAEHDDRGDEVSSKKPPGALQKIKRAVQWATGSVGDWEDATEVQLPMSESSFVRRNFLFIADYTGRAPWFILVELGVCTALGAAGAGAVIASSGSSSGNSSGCVAAAWAVLAALSLYLVRISAS